MDTSKLNPGDPVEPCHNDPTLRVRAKTVERVSADLAHSEGYTSRGYVQHFLPDREVNFAQLNQALADVFGEPALRTMGMTLEIDPGYWMQTCGNPWQGNIYQYRFRAPDFKLDEVEIIKEKIKALTQQVENLSRK